MSSYHDRRIRLDAVTVALREYGETPPEAAVTEARSIREAIAYETRVARRDAS